MKYRPFKLETVPLLAWVAAVLLCWGHETAAGWCLLVVVSARLCWQFVDRADRAREKEADARQSEAWRKTLKEHNAKVAKDAKP